MIQDSTAFILYRVPSSTSHRLLPFPSGSGIALGLLTGTGSLYDAEHRGKIRYPSVKSWMDNCTLI